MKKLLIIDGGLVRRHLYTMGEGMPMSSYLSECHKWLNKLAISTAEQYGFINTDDIIVAFDYPINGKYTKHDICQDYKSNRESSWTRAIYHEIGEKYTGNKIRLALEEADDIIASVSSKKYELRLIVTSDFDLLALVDNFTHVLLIGRTNSVLYNNYQSVKDKMGVWPHRIHELKAITGDADFVGVPGVGNKTAIQILNSYVSIDNFFRGFADDNILVSKSGKPKKTRQVILDNFDLIKKNLELAKLNKNLEIEIGPSNMFDNNSILDFDFHKSIQSLVLTDIASLSDDRVHLITDGACKKNGQGGYCAVLVFQGKYQMVSGHNEDTTNNKMELKACLEGLRKLPVIPGEPNYKFVIYSDSEYLVNSFNKGWIFDWERQGYKDRKNAELLAGILLNVRLKLDAEFRWIEGHSDRTETLYLLHNLVDKMAVLESQSVQNK